MRSGVMHKKSIFFIVIAMVFWGTACAASIPRSGWGISDSLTVQDTTAVSKSDTVVSDSAQGVQSIPVIVSPWRIFSLPTLRFEQFYFDNWASDGYTQTALTIGYVGTYVYTKPRYTWDSRIDVAFGFLRIDMDADGTFDDSQYLRKSDDKMDLTSTFSYKLKNRWNCNMSVNFKSQFYDSYKFYANSDQEPTLLSTFFSPAYLLTSFGFEYKEENWNVSASFLTGKSTFVLDERILPSNYGVSTGTSYMGWGSYLRFYFKKDIFSNINLYTRLEVFWEYQKAVARETDFNWESTIEFKVNSWLAAFVSMNLIYDTDFSLSRQIYQRSGIQIYFKTKANKK